MQTNVVTLQIRSNSQAAIPKVAIISATDNLQTLSDPQLYNLCKEYGKSARKWIREFGFLLPEVYRRRLYRKYRCSSIHMFAAKLAGMNYDVTTRILRLAEKLENLPLLWQEFRKFGWTKLAIVANVAVSETEKFWLDKLRKTPTLVLREYVRKWKEKDEKHELIENPASLFASVDDEKCKNVDFSLNEPQLSGTLKLVNEITDKDVATNLQKSRVRTTYKKLKFRVDPETEFEFKKFKQKLEQKRKVALTMGETLKALLKRVKALEAAKETVRTDSRKVKVKADTPQTALQVFRHIPNAQKRSVINQYNGKCAFPGCNEPYFELHHPDRFSICKSHEKIYPLCKIHHQAAHAGLIKNEDKPVEEWKLDFEVSTGSDGYNTNKNLENLIDPKDLNSIFAAYEKFRKNFADVRVREYFDG